MLIDPRIQTASIAENVPIKSVGVEVGRCFINLACFYTCTYLLSVLRRLNGLVKMACGSAFAHQRGSRLRT